MKNFTVCFLLMLALPATLMSQYTGGSGKGDVASELNGKYLSNWFKTAGNWNTLSNWSEGILPAASENANITAAAMLNGDYSYSALTIASTGSVTILPGKSLTVDGTLTNSSGTQGLVIESDATGTGSLIHPTTGVPATVNRYLTGAAESWHLWSSPVDAQPISGDFTPSGSYPDGSGYDFFTWYEPGNNWVNFKNTTNEPTWNTANGSNDFIVGKGYLVAYQATNPTKQFQGNLNTGTVTCTLSKSGTGSYAAYNLLGNPYPSAIDWKASGGWDRSNLVDAGGYDMSIWNQVYGNYGSFNSAGSSGTNGVTQHIPVGQGFMVKAASAGTFGMNNDIRVHNTQDYLKTSDEISNTLRLKVSGLVNTYADELVIEFGHQLANGGTEKLFSLLDSAPSLYTVKQTGNYSIDFRGEPGTVAIPVSFKAGVDGNYTLTASLLESFTSSTMIVLEDLEAVKMQDLLQNPAYTFTATKNDEGARFLLHFTGVGINESRIPHPVSVYSSGNTLYISTKSGITLAGDVYVYNMMGHNVIQQELNDTPLTKINIGTFTGYYLIKVITGNHVYSEKVFINH